MELKDIQNEELNDLMGYFLAEVKNQQGEDYKPNTLYEIVAAIQHAIRQSGRLLNFFDDHCFEGMRKVLDAKMKELSSRGLGLDKKKADIISVEQEDKMWKDGILGTDTPQKLLDTLVYVLGLNFALRAGQEHRNLRVGPLSQLKTGIDQHGCKYIEYQEDISKTNRGGIKHRKMQPKVTRAYENKINSERCPLQIYQKYLSLRPKQGKIDALYLRPLRSYTNMCWYMDSPVGVHLLQKTVGNLCAAAGFQGHYTNHSLRATAATRLYIAGIDEQLITEKTGHRSNAVRDYKRTNDGQLKEISNILQANCGPCDDTSDTAPKKIKTEEKSAREINIRAGDVSFQMKF